MDIYEKARELGMLILASDASKELADIQAEFALDASAQERLNAYSERQKAVQDAMEKGELSKEDFEKSAQKLREMGTALKADPVVGRLITAETDYNKYVNSVMNVLKSTIMGEGGCDCESGDCGGCSGCH